MFDDGLPTDWQIHMYIYISWTLEPLDIYRPICDMSGRECGQLKIAWKQLSPCKMDGQMIHEAMFDQTESTYNVLDIWIVGWPAMFGILARLFWNHTVFGMSFGWYDLAVKT